MSSYAKWIGGMLGWAVGGPIGAILGFGLGAAIDSTALTVTSGAKERVRTTPGDFSASLLVLAAAVMKADEKVLKSELTYVKTFLRSQFGEETARQQVLMLKDILHKQIDLESVCRQIRYYMEASSRLQLLHFLFGIANADGHLDQREVDVIARIASYLGISRADYQSIAAMFGTATDRDYEILEVKPVATDDEVKKAYRKMAVKYHPDKLSHLGEDVQQSAKEKFQKVQEAYDNIRKKRGMK